MEVDLRAQRCSRRAGGCHRPGHLHRRARESVSDLPTHWSQMSAAEPDERRRAAWRLADEMRRIIELLTLVDAPSDELARVADAAATFADRLNEWLPKRTWS